MTTFDTSLYFKRIPHREYAHALMNARYAMSAVDCAVKPEKRPPAKNPAAIITSPPTTNCHPESITGFSVFEKYLEKPPENP